VLRFSLHEVKIGSRFYLLLPKLNPRQMLTIELRLRAQGFSVRADPQIIAKKDREILHCLSSGLCWSGTDPSDALIPVIPELLASPKDEVSVSALKEIYFGMVKSGSAAMVRFLPRMEGGPTWRLLRAMGACSLAPDELAVLDFLLEHASGGCNLVTDFPAPRVRKRIIHGRQFYETNLPVADARSTLASVGSQADRNSYLPKRGILKLSTFNHPSRREYLELFESLGEWCYFQPDQRKGLIARAARHPSPR